MLQLLMDRFEKESDFQTKNDQGGSVVDADAVCCISLDGKLEFHDNFYRLKFLTQF